MNVALILGLGAAVAWGSADFCAKKAAVEFGFWPTVLAMNGIGALLLGVGALGGAIPWPRAEMTPLLWLALGNAAGGLLFYYALEFGPLVLVSPITAGYPVVSVVLAYLVTGERLGWRLGLAVGGVIAGTLLASVGRSTSPPGPRRGSALAAAALCAVIFGSVFFGLAAHAGGGTTAAPVLVFRLVGTGLLALPLLAGRRLPRRLWRSGWVWGTGVLDSSAYLFYVAGAHHLPVSVVSALSGLFCVWTLMLAFVFLRERLAGRQWLGVLLILAAIALLAARG